MAGIRFEKVDKRFGGVVVVRNLDLAIKDGEFFTFVGPSGCGKSTVLNMIAGLEPVTAGRIFFDGATVNDLSPRERDVAMVFQSYALYPHMTVHENIAFPLKMKKVPKEEIEGEVNRISSLLGLTELLRRKPKELSGGQRQRVALGRAIIRKPKAFLMDEPLSNLDARLRIEMRAELKRLHHELGITTVYVTHDQEEAMGLSDRIAVIHKGEVQQCGAPHEVYRRPANRFVGGFIGSPPMDFIPGVVRSRDPLEIDCNSYRLSPANLVESLPVESKVLVGIRPEDVRVSPEKHEGAVDAVLVLMESAGPYYWADCEWNRVKVRGKAEDAAGLTEGSSAYLSFNREKTVIFDAVSGRLLKSD